MNQNKFSYDELVRIKQWMDLKAQVTQYQEAERALRDELITAYGKHDKVEGVEHIPVDCNGHTFDMEITKNLDYSVDDKAPVGMISPLDLLEEYMLTLKGGPALFDSMFRFKAELSVKIYKYTLPIFQATLPAAQREALTALLSQIITVKPASPSLKMNPPKG